MGVNHYISCKVCGQPAGEANGDIANLCEVRHSNCVPKTDYFVYAEGYDECGEGMRAKLYNCGSLANAEIFFKAVLQNNDDGLNDLTELRLIQGETINLWAADGFVDETSDPRHEPGLHSPVQGIERELTNDEIQKSGLD
jgi:hypothetical protein